VCKDELLNCTSPLCSVHTTASNAALQTKANRLLQVLYPCLLLDSGLCFMLPTLFKLLVIHTIPVTQNMFNLGGRQ